MGLWYFDYEIYLLKEQEMYQRFDNNYLLDNNYFKNVFNRLSHKPIYEFVLIFGFIDTKSHIH